MIFKEYFTIFLTVHSLFQNGSCPEWGATGGLPNGHEGAVPPAPGVPGHRRPAPLHTQQGDRTRGAALRPAEGVRRHGTP